MFQVHGLDHGFDLDEREFLFRTTILLRARASSSKAMLLDPCFKTVIYLAVGFSMSPRLKGLYG